MFAAVLRMRKRAEVLVATVNKPNVVTPVFAAIVIVPLAVLTIQKSVARFTAGQVTSDSSVVPKGIVTV